MITEATKEQWAEIEKCRLRWLYEEQTSQYPIEDIRQTVLKTCESASLGTPAFVWVVDCPIVARIISSLLTKQKLDANLGDNLHANLWDNLRDNLWDNLRDNLWDNLWNNLSANLWNNLSDNLRDNLMANLGTNLRTNLWDNLGNNLSANLRNNLGDNLEDNLKDNLEDNLNLYCGKWWNSRAGWFEGGDILGVPRIPEYELFRKWNRHCSVWMWDKSMIYILRNPKSIHWNDNGLHNDVGPAIDYSPTYKLWFIDGIMVDHQVVMSPETQTIDQIHKEDNEDIRSIRIERFGWMRYLEETDAKVIDYRHNDIDNLPEILCSTDYGKKLVVGCQTKRQFVLGVPDEINSCADAQQWLNRSENLNMIGAT